MADRAAYVKAGPLGSPASSRHAVLADMARQQPVRERTAFDVEDVFGKARYESLARSFVEFRFRTERGALTPPLSAADVGLRRRCARLRAHRLFPEHHVSLAIGDERHAPVLRDDDREPVRLDR